MHGDEEARKSVEERYRYVGYRQFVAWIYQQMGKDIRVGLPSCVLRRIRQEFPSESYTGFKLPDEIY
jgi:hypothetical protein